MTLLLSRNLAQAAGLVLLGSAAQLLAAPNALADESAQIASGKKLFTQSAVPACALCHTLKDAGATGAVGPVLDELRPNTARVVSAVRNGLGNMPSYKDALNEEQILALARYVAFASKAQE